MPIGDWQSDFLTDSEPHFDKIQNTDASSAACLVSNAGAFKRAHDVVRALSWNSVQV